MLPLSSVQILPSFKFSKIQFNTFILNNIKVKEENINML